MSVFEISVIFLWVGFIAVLLILTAVLRRLREIQEQFTGMSSIPAGLPLGEIAPSFDMVATDGRRVSLPSPSYHPTIIGFFSAHCDSCREQAQSFRELAEVAIARGFEVVSFVEGMPDESQPLVGKLAPVPVVLVPFNDTTQLLSAYRVAAFPSYIAANAEREVVAVGALPQEIAQSLGLPCPASKPAGGRPSGASHQ